MKILFFCGSLERGADGVGDYTRRLAAECVRAGNECEIIAINDRLFLPSLSPEEIQMDEGTAIQCLRLSSQRSWSERVQLARSWSVRFLPDRCSLQFVSFSFHDKGLCYSLAGRLQTIAPKAVWHIMFHELWVVSLQRNDVKHAVWKFLQYAMIRQLVWVLNPPLIHSHARPYLDDLKRFHPEVKQLLLFGNISAQNCNKEQAWNLILTKLEEANLKVSKRSEVQMAGVFGSLSDEWLPCDFVTKWADSVAEEKKPVIVFFGRGYEPHLKHKALNERLSSLVTVLNLGPLPEDLIAGVLTCLDFAIATTLWSHLEKSGSLAAFRDFGLPVVVLAEAEAEKYPMSADIYRASSVDSKTLNAMRRSESASSNLTTVAKLFLSSLKGK